ncbi:peptidoglycan-binding protein [Rhizobium sp. WYJ-E13]|uniref:peptidoglycan-binding protein n=1 Tax=Rhizobium sp. WYJ-E13 TaxID=2849093 RepID=UPI001C1EA8CC|nr:peptidoglycan-binding protein [Rhizobium sp. WYJ-E13]QWW70028.1 peptidoglycan-binding protein [Rhizobium sp. WYJ-E13]
MLIESKQRRFWRDYEDNIELMTEIYFGDALIRVARPTVSAWDALEAIMHSFNYRISPSETSGYTPKVANSTVNDLRSFGIAVNVNTASNPQRQTTDKRKVWFSTKLTQVERAHDVLENAADTDMSADMIDAIRAVRTLDKKRVFGWGGDRPTKKSAGFFFINVSPEELARGLDNRTVKRPEEVSPKPDEDDENFDADVPIDPVLEEEMFGETETMVDVIHIERFRVLLDFIANHEGTAQQPGGGYNTSLAFGALIGGEKKLTNMTLNQIDALQTLMLKNPDNKWNSSALGRYQIVRKTLRGLRTQLGRTGNELYSPDLQDRLATMLINRRGRSVPGLRAEWASLQKVSEVAILAAYDGILAGQDDKQIEIPREERDITKILEALWERLGVSTPQPFPTPIAISPMPQLALKPGDRGPAVQALQEALSRRNYQVGKIDGIYGSMTVGAVAAFQIDYNVPTDHIGTVDGPTWDMLANAANRPLSEDRLNASADDLRRMGSQIVLNADRTKIVAILTSVFGALGLGSATLGDYRGAGGSSGSATAAQTATTNSPISVDQQIAHLISGFSSDQYRNFFGLRPEQVTAARIKIEDLEKLYNQSNSSQQTSQVGPRPDLVDPLIGLAAGAANIFLPGVGGSLALLALGAASHIFGSRIINRRVQDQRTGANIGAIGRN